MDPPLTETESLWSSRTVDAESNRSRLRIVISLLYAAGGNFAAADSNGAPCSGSAKIKDTEAGALFFDMDIDLQADGDAEPLRRRPELIDIVACCNRL